MREDNKIRRIIEEKDANDKTKKIQEINTGIICVKESVLRKYEPRWVKNNNKQKNFILLI